MPCSDGGVPFPPTRYEVLTSKMPAALCAILSAVDDPLRLIKLIDDQEAGVTKGEVAEWWAMHKIRDRDRRIQERRAAEERTLSKAAKAKLTPAELRALKKSWGL